MSINEMFATIDWRTNRGLSKCLLLNFIKYLEAQFGHGWVVPTLIEHLGELGYDVSKKQRL